MIAVVVIVGAIGVIWLTSHSNPSTYHNSTYSNSSQTTSSPTTELTSVTQGNGLEFMMSLNSSSLGRGSNLTVSLNLYNPLTGSITYPGRRTGS